MQQLEELWRRSGIELEGHESNTGPSIIHDITMENDEDAIGDYVLVNFKSSRMFTGVITEIGADKLTINFLYRYKDDKFRFSTCRG